jgi:rod shape-determining protein MreD
MTAAASLRATAVVFVAALLQVVIVSSFVIAGGAPDLLLVVVVVLGLLRGSIPGAVLGFVGGLIVDLVTLGTLGVSSLVLTLAGFWAGRYGETTGRGRRYAPPVAAFAISIAAGLGGVAIHFLLGQPVSAREALVTLFPSALLAALLVLPIVRLCRVVIAPPQQYEPARRVELV